MNMNQTQTTTTTLPNIQAAQYPPRLVVFCGRARSGKDTCASYLSQVWNYRVNHFAGPLKNGCKSFFGFNDDQLNGESKMQEDTYWHLTPRTVFQQIGTEVMRRGDGFPRTILSELRRQANPDPVAIAFWEERAAKEDFWIHRIRRDYAELPEGKSMVIADGRFPNEIDFANQVGGICIRINRPGTAKMEHDSERFIDDLVVDYDITNDGTISDLISKVESILGLNATCVINNSNLRQMYFNGLDNSMNSNENIPAPNMLAIFCSPVQAGITEPVLRDYKYTVFTGPSCIQDMVCAYRQNPGGRYAANLAGSGIHVVNEQEVTVVEILERLKRSRYSAHMQIRYDDLGQVSTELSKYLDSIKGSLLCTNAPISALD